jgi:uncharacterized delta-60 repeat protein
LDTGGKIIAAGYSLNGTDSDFTVARYNIDGSLDSSFGVGGVVKTPVGSGSVDQANAVALQADGKIVVAGQSGSQFALVRYHPDGILDTSLDGDGKVTTSIGSVASSNAMAIQSDGRIILAGLSFDGGYKFALARYNSDGSLDVSFDGDGKLTTSVGGLGDFSFDMALQSDGRIVVVGYANTMPNSDVAVVRYNSDGSLDSSFDGDGKVTTPVGSSVDIAYAVAVDASGKIIVAGRAQGASEGDIALVRYHSNGALDSSFDSDGKLITAAVGDDEAHALALQPDGSIVAAGRLGWGQLAVVRYSTSGNLDGSFDGDGKAVTGIGATSDTAYAVALQADGKVVVAGRSGNYDIALARYELDGTLDVSFDDDGILTTSIGNSDGASAVALQPDGKIVAAGATDLGGNIKFAIVRYEPDGTLDNSFDADGKLTTQFGIGCGSNVSAVVLQPDGKIVAAGRSLMDCHVDNDFALARYHSDGSLDLSFDDDGKLTTTFGGNGDEARAMVLQTDGRIVVAGRSFNGADYDFALARYDSDGSLDTTFDGDGKLTTTLGSDDDEAFALALQADGRIVAAGNSSNGSDIDLALVRYNADGSLDATFDADGKLTTAVGPTYDYAHAVVVQADGKIVVAGYSAGGSDPDVAVVRYNADGTLDVAFNGDGKVTTAIGAQGDGAHSMVLQADGKIVVAGYSSSGAGDFAVLRYLASDCGDGDIDGAEECDLGALLNGSVTACCSSSCLHESSSKICRSVAAACDAPETCTGAGTTCPPDEVSPYGTPCRAAFGECDVAEFCTGLSASCPIDDVVAGGTPCTDDGSICTTDQCNGAGLCAHPANGTCENTSTNLPPGGSINTDTENDGATPSDPVETEITVPGGGTVTIEERPFTNSPDGFFLFGNEVEIDAPNATPADPLVMAFRLDASVLFPQPFGQDEIDVGYPFVFKDAALVANCSGVPVVASPDPCIESRVLQGDGDVIVTVRTSTASLWQFAVPSGECPDTVDGGCVTGFQKAFLLIKENVPGKEKLVAKLGGGPALAQTDLGNPLSGAEGGTGTMVSLCIYDGNDDLAGELVAAGPTSTCTDGAPCWKSIGSAPNDPNGPGKGYAYKDTNADTDGVQKLLYKGGDAGKPKAIVKAKGSSLPLGIPAALQTSTQATIQLRSSDAECLSATVSDIKKQEAGFFKAK